MKMERKIKEEAAIAVGVAELGGGGGGGEVVVLLVEEPGGVVEGAGLPVGDPVEDATFTASFCP